MSCKPKKNSLRMADGGEAVNRWAGQQLRMADGGVQGLMGGDRLAQQNAATAASSIVKDASQQAGAAALGVTRPAFPAVPYNAQPVAGAKAFTAPPAVPGVSPLAPNPTDQRPAAGTQASPGMPPSTGATDIQFDSATRTLSNAAGRANAPLASPLTMGSAQNQAARNSLLQRTPGFTDFSKRPQDGLFMADGGEAPPTSLRGLYNRITAPRAPASAPQPAASAPTPALTGISGYVANSALARREAAAGLQDGGQVPGSGEGDKIPAKYEPGEFVVSNDMIDDNPGLRETLHSLRAETLNARGRTVAEADAKAVGYSGAHEALQGPRGARDSDSHHPVDRASEGSHANARVGRPQSIRALDGIEVLERPWAGSADARMFAQQPGPGNPNVGPNARAVHVPAQPAPTAPPQSRAFRAGQRVGEAYRDSKGAGKAGVLAGASIDASWDALGRPTEDYRRRLGMDPNPTHDDGTAGGRALQGVSDLGVRALGHAGDVGAAILDLPVNTLNAGIKLFGGAGDVSLPGGSFTEILQRQDNPAAAKSYAARQTPQGVVAPARPVAAPVAAAPTPVAAPAQPVAAPAPAPTMRSGFDGFTAPVQAQDEAPIMVAPSIRHSGNDWQARNDLRSLEVKAGGINQKRPRGGMSVAEAAYLGAQKHDQELKGGNTLAEVAGIKAASEANTARNSLRGHRDTADKQLLGTLATAGARSRDAQANAQREQIESDRKYALDVAKFGTDVADKTRSNRIASEKAFSDRISSMVGNDKDGTIAARVRNGANAHLDKAMAEADALLAKEPNNASALARKKAITEQGLNLLGEDDIRAMVIGQKANAVAADYDGWMPWKGEAKNTDTPVTKLTLKKGLLFDDYVANNGQTIPARALRENPDLQRLDR